MLSSWQFAAFRSIFSIGAGTAALTKKTSGNAHIEAINEVVRALCLFAILGLCLLELMVAVGVATVYTMSLAQLFVAPLLFVSGVLVEDRTRGTGPFWKPIFITVEHLRGVTPPVQALVVSSGVARNSRKCSISISAVCAQVVFARNCMTGRSVIDERTTPICCSFFRLWGCLRGVDRS